MYKLKHLSKSAKNAILFIILGILVCTAFFLALRAWENRQYRLDIPEDIQNGDVGQDELLLDGKAYRQRKGLETILLIGLDKYDSEVQSSADSLSNSQQSDYLMLLILDRDANLCTPLHLNRDSMAPVRVLGMDGRTIKTVTEQLALAHTYGSGGDDSCRNTVKAVSDLLYGIPIDHYVAVTLDAVPALNDLVGGVRLEIPDDFSEVDPSLIQGQTMCMNGEQALHFVRARGGMEDSTNLARMERQRQYMLALRDSLRKCIKEDEYFPTKALAKLSEHMMSDCMLDRLSNLICDALEWEMAEIETIPGEAVKGKEFMEFYPDEQAMKDIVIRLFYEAID